MRWLDTDVRKYRNYMGRFDNVAHQTSLRHEETVRVFNDGEDITLFEVREPTKEDGSGTSEHAITIKLRSELKSGFKRRRPVRGLIEKW